MTTKRIVLVSSIVLLIILPFVVSYYRGKATQTIISKYPEYIPIEEILPVHEGRIKERVDLLKKQTLDETFVYLLDDQQYFYPGFHPEAKLVPKEIETILSTRSTLKVFQQFDALPREQAIKKLNELSKRAIGDFDETLQIILRQKANPTLESSSNKSAKYMLCVALLLAARAGDIELLLNQINVTLSHTDAFIEKMKAYEPEGGDSWRYGVSFEDDCILTVLLYALKSAGKDADVSFAGNLKKKTILLCRWDAVLTYYDFEVVRGLKTLNPKDVVEQFDVYAFSGEDRFDVQKKKLIIDTLKERLSM